MESHVDFFWWRSNAPSKWNGTERAVEQRQPPPPVRVAHDTPNSAQNAAPRTNRFGPVGPVVVAFPREVGPTYLKFRPRLVVKKFAKRKI